MQTVEKNIFPLLKEAFFKTDKRQTQTALMLCLNFFFPLSKDSHAKVERIVIPILF